MRITNDYHSLSTSGNATRLCNSDGQWSEDNVLNCTSREFIELEEILVRLSYLFTEMNAASHVIPVSTMHLFVKVNTTLSNLQPEEQIMIATDVIQQLIQVTEPQNKLLLPNDLSASARILTAVVDVLENNNMTNEVWANIKSGYLHIKLFPLID